MEIIKDGKKKFGKQTFTCETCSSVFTEWDYKINKSFIELESSLFKGYKIQLSTALTQWCPVCGAQCTNHVPTEEPPFWTLFPYSHL